MSAPASQGGAQSVRLQTTQGAIVLELYANEAPRTVHKCVVPAQSSRVQCADAELTTRAVAAAS
jgi:hypothetical protein